MEDTIIAPQGVMSLDRYSYARNAPVVFVDPSGNTACRTKEECDDMGITPGGQQLGLSDVLLTHKGDRAITEDGDEFTRIRGGVEIYQLFLKFQANCGWWNNQCKTPFGFEEFLGMWILFEATTSDAATSLAIADLLSTIVAQNLFVGGTNPAVCKAGGACFNAIFNFIAANVDGSSAILSGPGNAANKLFAAYNPGLGTPDKMRELISSFGNKALDPNSVVGDRFIGPSMWGNINGSDALQKLLPHNANGTVITGSAENTVYYIFGSAAYYSVNQYNYWTAFGIDMSLLVK